MKVSVKCTIIKYGLAVNVLRFLSRVVKCFVHLFRVTLENQEGMESQGTMGNRLVHLFLVLTCLFPVVLFVYLFIPRLFVCLQTILTK